MRLLSVVVVVGLLSVPVAREAAAAPVMTGVAQMAPDSGGASVEKVYYYYRGVRYPYRYRGMYFRHRYYSGGRYRYY